MQTITRILRTVAAMNMIQGGFMLVSGWLGASAARAANTVMPVRTAVAILACMGGAIL